MRIAVCILLLFAFSGTSSEQVQCTRPASSETAKQPFCFLPTTISREAKDFLQPRGVTPSPDLNVPGAAGRVQAAFNAFTSPASTAAAAQFLQSVRNDTIDGVPVSIGTPKGFKPQNADKLLVYLHGGAYVKGSCYHLWNVVAMLSQLSGLKAMCVEYRLAPQHAYPAALEDVLMVYRALVKKYKPSKVALVGDSAGGGLSLAMLQAAKQQGLQLPGALMLMSPWSDLSKSGDTLTTLTAVDPVLQYELNLEPAVLAYTGWNKTRIQDPAVSPLYSTFAAPFPPTIIQVGTRDSFLSDSSRLYRKMKDAGLTVEFSPWEGMWHVFQALLQVPEAQQAHEELAEWIRNHLGY